MVNRALAKCLSRGRYSGLVCMACFILCAPFASAQQTPDEVRMAATTALGRGDFEEAIIHLTQLVDWYGDSRQQNIIAMMGDVYFNLGLSYLFVTRFGDAEQTFMTYLERYRHGPHAHQSAVMLGDVRRFQQAFDRAIEAYQAALSRYELSNDLAVDAFVGIARSHLAEDRWDLAIPELTRVFQRAPDFTRRNWAATMLAISFLQERQPEALYPIMTVLLQPESFTSRSVLFNMVALEVADDFFAEEKFREALWIYRLVYPYDTVLLNTILFQERMEQELTRVRRNPRNPRPILRIQEALGDVEVELEALSELENYDPQLFYRVARAYMENRRYREARDLFRNIHAEGMEEYAEQALYMALVCAARTEPVTTTIAIAETYLREYPGGDFYDEASLLLGQIHAQREDWPSVLEVLSEALTVSPEHSYITEVLFMLGYACFMEEMFVDAVRWLTRLNGEFPQNDRYIDAEYWLGMAHLFDGAYADAMPHFRTVIDEDPHGMYTEDATFRYASCLYGLPDFDAAETELLRFLERFPGTRLGGEAYVMLGDIAGARGDVDLALSRFRRVADYGEHVNIELYNYTAFRMGEMMNDRNAYGEMIRHFEDYIARNRPGSNLSQAQFWIGHALWQQDERDRAMVFYLDTIKQYGRDRMELGVDLIMDDWIGKSRALPLAEQQRVWRELGRLHDQAMREREITLALRLKRMMMYDPHLSESEIVNLRLQLISPRAVPHVSMANLQFMLADAQRTGNTNLLFTAAEELVRVFPETDAGMEARLVLGRRAFEAGESDEALLHLNEVREKFAGSEFAAQALLMIGDLHAAAARHDDADLAFQDVLGVREWRHLWPEALFKRGENARQARQYERASAFYERIYVLYGGHPEWTARAYLARAQTLQRLREFVKAREVLEEFVGFEALADQPEFAEGQALLQQLRRRM